MDTLVDVAAFVGGSGVLVAALAWLARSILNLYMTRDVEQFKANLQHTSNIEIERLRHDLRLVASDVEKRSALLNEKRAEVVAELYKRLVDFVAAAESFASFAEWKGEPSKDAKAEILGTKAGDFITYYQHHRIYFSEPLCSSLKKLFDAVHGPAISFRMWSKLAERGGNASIKHDEAWNNAWNAIQKDVPPILAEIEKEFRSILGVHVA